MKNRERKIPIRAKGNPLPLGTTVKKEGVNFSISLPNENKCILHIYDKNTKEKKDSYLLTKEDKVGGVFSVFLQNINPSECIYRYEIKEKELIDPYAKVIVGREQFGSYHKNRERETYGGFLSDSFSFLDDIKLNIPYHELIVYKLNVRGFTKDNSSCVMNKGTFDGIREKIPYLKELGINSVMLMPCYEFDEIILLDTFTNQFKVNVWGYSESNYYFAPKSSYSNTGNADLELMKLIYELHQNGIELFMEMHFVRGTNQTLIYDCIRYWVEEYHVDGFKLSGDLVPLTLLSTDPILSETKIIGEGFNIEEIYPKDYNPAFINLAHYNNNYSNDVKQFLRGEEEKVYSFTQQFMKHPYKSGVINYIANHDGFTLNDLYSYDVKHNELNQEHNRDGTNYNYSTNCGMEGKTDDEMVLRLREKRIKNALVTLFFSQGTPLLLAGDEFLQSNEGNNNCYCVDNEVYYTDWSLEKKNKSMVTFVKKLIDIRKMHPILHKEDAFSLMDYLSIGIPDISFHSMKAWFADYTPYNRMLGIMLAGEYVLGKNNTMDNTFYIAYNMHGISHEYDLPILKKGFEWNVLIHTNSENTIYTENDSKLELSEEINDNQNRYLQRVTVEAYSILILIGKLEEVK